MMCVDVKVKLRSVKAREALATVVRVTTWVGPSSTSLQSLHHKLLTVPAPINTPFLAPTDGPAEYLQSQL
jgi:hypothetical protein